MQAVDLQSPEVLAMVIAESGATNNIPVDPSGTYLASQAEGFPSITMQPSPSGGEPPDGRDFNGFMKLWSSHLFSLQNGGRYTFDESVSTAIGGYPENACLWYVGSDGYLRYLKSTKDNNTDNFITNPDFIGTSWIDAIPTESSIEGKANVALDNVTTAGKNVIADNSMPDRTRAVNRSNNVSYTVTEDVEVYIRIQADSAITTPYVVVTDLNGDQHVYYSIIWLGGTAADYEQMLVRVRKGETYRVFSNATSIEECPIVGSTA